MLYFLLQGNWKIEQNMKCCKLSANVLFQLDWVENKIEFAKLLSTRPNTPTFSHYNNSWSIPLTNVNHSLAGYFTTGANYTLKLCITITVAIRPSSSYFARVSSWWKKSVILWNHVWNKEENAILWSSILCWLFVSFLSSNVNVLQKWSC